MRPILSVVPAITVAALTFAAVLPWGASKTLQFLLPFLPLIAIHYWVQQSAGLMPVWFVFLCGLVIDALTSGPLGFWSFIFLLGFAFALWASNHRLAQWWLGRWLGVALSMILANFAVWAMSSLYFVRMFDWYPLVLSAVGATMIYPLLALLFWPLARVSHWTEANPGSA